MSPSLIMVIITISPSNQIDDGQIFNLIFQAVQVLTSPTQLFDSNDLLPLLVRYGTDDQLRTIAESSVVDNYFLALPNTQRVKVQGALTDAERLLRICHDRQSSVTRQLITSRRTRQGIGRLLQSVEHREQFPMLDAIVTGRSGKNGVAGLLRWVLNGFK